ncbi:MAG: bifunctional 4-hydroxy-2-oxoglutarate aldolase/2-dehydro-3-deoxy-phosphogluconate aldolase [Clostridiaceae bacterium]|nr:bifunctional 4-hydroxy-2-oxoglutarate aldolase/2-dehydro-3-deoxy-phosphogluconate aldolase [Clostridiaceae bacterium]
MKMRDRLASVGVVPVVKLGDINLAEALAGAFCEGGIPCAEVTFRAAGAAEVIRRMRARYPDMLVGAGTVLTVAQAKEALDAGAEFVVAPGLNPRIVDYVLTRGGVMLPGVMTPTEIEAALAFGLDTLKFFPAEQAGGRAMLKALSAPYAGVKFVPTGGISPDNLTDYLELPCVAACGGSYMSSAKLLDARDFAAITALCAEAAATVRQVREG